MPKKVMSKEENNFEFSFVYSIDENILKEMVLRIQKEKFLSYMAESLEDEKTKAYIATALPYLKERNRICNLLQNDGNGNNQFDQSDIELSTGNFTNSRKLVLRKSRIKNIKKNFLRNFNKWNTPICVKGDNSEETFYIASKEFRKFQVSMIRVSEKTYLAALLRAGRYDELAERASIEQIKELINLGRISARITEKFVDGNVVIPSQTRKQSIEKSKKIIDKMNWGKIF